VSAEDNEPSGRPSISKTIENVEKIRELIRKYVAEQSISRRHRCDQLWCLPGDLNRKFEHVLQCHEACSLTLDKWSKAAARKRVSWATREG
jgi:hypothetical protein